MTAYDLIYNYQFTHPSGHFFDRDTLKFFGERISEMIVWKNTVTVTDNHGKNHTCYVLSTLQRNHPSGKQRAYHYFDSITFDEVFT